MLTRAGLSTAGGQPNGAPTLHLTLPGGEQIRFQWKSATEVEGQFWEKGKRDGEGQYNAPKGTTKLRRARLGCSATMKPERFQRFVLIQPNGDICIDDSWQGEWSWKDDDSFGKNHSKLIAKSGGKLCVAGSQLNCTVWEYVYGSLRVSLEKAFEYYSPANYKCVRFDLPNGDHLRFGWEGDDVRIIEGKFWRKGKKESDPPDATSKLTRLD